MSDRGTIKYESKIVHVGEDVEAFMQEEMLVFFDDTAPPELQAFAVVHEKHELTEDVEAGDLMEISGERYEILFVGSKVNDTFRELGHCTVLFNGERRANLPGMMCVEKKPLPPLRVDATVCILRP